MRRHNHEMDPDDLRQLDESVERVYWELSDSEELLNALSHLDNSRDYRYISGYDELEVSAKDSIDVSILATAAVSGCSAIWCGAMSQALEIRGYESWTDILETGAVSSGVVFGITIGTWGLRKAIRRYRNIDRY